MSAKKWNWSQGGEKSLTRFLSTTSFLKGEYPKDHPLLVAVLPTWSFPSTRMKRESFNNPYVARTIHSFASPIFVNPAEYPPLARRALEVMSELVGIASFPSIILTLPNGHPFLAFHYLPPYGTEDNPGLSDILIRIGENYDQVREEIKKQISEFPFQAIDYQREADDDLTLMRYILTQVIAEYDDANGSFPNSPKFPFYPLHSFLWDYYVYTGARVLGLKITRMLHRMRQQGLVDPLRGGVFRVSYKKDWSEPSFEKLLVDNAWYLRLLAQASFASNDRDVFLRELRRQAEFIQREMKGIGNFFARALLPHSGREEGDPYLWTIDELRSILPIDQIEEFLFYAQVKDSGNCRFKEKNILRFDPFQLSLYMDLPEIELQNNIFNPLLNYLEENGRTPLLDFQPIASEQASIALSFLAAYAATRDKAFLLTAKSIYQDLADRFLDGNTIIHTYTQDGDSVPGFPEDYALFEQLQLYLELIGELSSRINIMDQVIKLFWSDENRVFKDDSTSTWLGDRYPYTDEMFEGLNPLLALTYEASIGASKTKGTKIRHHVLTKFIKPARYELERVGGFAKLASPRDVWILSDVHDKKTLATALLVGAIPSTWKNEPALLVLHDPEKTYLAHKTTVEPLTSSLFDRLCQTNPSLKRNTPSQ